MPYSGDQVIAALARLGFAQVHQRGSHVKLRRDLDGVRRTVVVPRHRELRRGTLAGIADQPE